MSESNNTFLWLIVIMLILTQVDRGEKKIEQEIPSPPSGSVFYTTQVEKEER